MSQDVGTEAWARLLEELRGAGEIVTGPLGGRTERERAEGFRHVLRVLSIASEMILEKGDPARPSFTRWMSPHRKMLGDNPGTIYDAVLVDPAVTYRISGQRGTCAYLGICVYGTAKDGARRIVGNIDDDEMQIADDGTFEVLLGRERPAGATGAFLALDDDSTDVMVRQYFADPDSEYPATYTIAAAAPTGPEPPLTEGLLAQRLDAVGAYVRDIVEVEATLSALAATATPAVLRAGSEFVDDDGKAAAPPVDLSVVARVMPSPAIQYAGSWFDDLGDDEVLVVEGTVPTCRYWSVQLLTRWMESGDYRYHRVHRAGRDITTRSDGTFTVVVAHRDPGGGDWLDTTGLRNANIAVRALKADGQLAVTFRRERRP